MKKLFTLLTLLLCLASVGFAQCHTCPANVRIVATPNPNGCCQWDFFIDDLPEDVGKTTWIFNYDVDCLDTTICRLTVFDPDLDHTVVTQDCFEKTLVSLTVIITNNDGTQCIACFEHPNFYLRCAPRSPICDPDNSLFDNVKFTVSYAEFGISPCTDTNLVGYRLEFSGLPNLCTDLCPEMIPEVSVCWTDGCIDYRENFGVRDTCEGSIYIGPLLVGSEYTVSLRHQGTCCSAPYIGSVTSIAGYVEPCDSMDFCDPACDRSELICFVKDVEECLPRPLKCDSIDLNVQVIYSGEPIENYYKFESVIDYDTCCEIVDYEWRCWRYNPNKGYQESIPCGPSTIDEVYIDISSYCDKDAVGACLILWDNCDCGPNFACHRGKRIDKDPCEYEILFSEVQVEGGLIFTLSPNLLDCGIGVEWTANCDEFDIPVFPFEEGVIVYPPPFLCFSFTICASIEGCEPVCLFVPGFAQPNDDRSSIRDGIFNDDSPNFNPTIHPNPVENILHIKSEESMISKLQIFDSTGKIVYKYIQVNDLPDIELDVSEYSSGFYFILCSDETGARQLLKFIKE